jgi:hypothetical protein
VSCLCEKLVAEEGERPPFKAAAEERLVETVTDWEH